MKSSLLCLQDVRIPKVIQFLLFFFCDVNSLNLLKPKDIYICRTAALRSRRYILNIYSKNKHTEYFKHAA